MAAVVHHGGAGTTAAGLYAGKPAVIIPHKADQPAWGRRVYELRVAPKPLMRKKLNAENLANAIQLPLEKVIIVNASELGVKLRMEEGVTNDYEKSKRKVLNTKAFSVNSARVKLFTNGERIDIFI